MKHIFIILHLTFAAWWAVGQSVKTDSVYTLQSVEVISTRLNDFAVGQKIERIDSLTISQAGSAGLGEILFLNTSLNINRYNHNGLNLLAVRGTTAAQSSIYWNGIQISPPNNGLFDLSLIPGGYFNSIKILYGGSSSLYGSGNIGAGIHLNNEPNFNGGSRFEVSASAGSFRDYSGQVKATISKPNWFFNTQIFGRKAENDFPYTDLNGIDQKFNNAALLQKGLMQDIYKRFGQKSIAGFSFWYQENDKEIPATLTSKPSDASQLDRAIRAIASFRHFIDKGDISAKLAVFNDYEHYVDPDSIEILVIDSEIKTIRYQADATIKKQIWDPTIMSFGIDMIHLTGESINYPDRVRQDQVGAFFRWKQKLMSNRLVMSINLRQDFNSDYNMPFIPAIGIEGIIFKHLSARISASRNFRVPTFNDLYWIPGGNPDLEPESSWNQEIGLDYIHDSIAGIGLKAGLTIFNSMVENWIMWVPDGNLWAPLNVQKVWARGLETNAGIDFKVHHWNFNMNGSYTFTRSTNENKLSEGDQTYQKQLIYIPLHRYVLNLHISWHYYAIRFNHTFTGQRYVTSDNQTSLESYPVSNLIFDRRFEPGKQTIVTQFGIQNIFNTTYQAVQYYPMPGRSYNLSLKLILK